MFQSRIARSESEESVRLFPRKLALGFPKRGPASRNSDSMRALWHVAALGLTGGFEAVGKRKDENWQSGAPGIAQVFVTADLRIAKLA